MAQVRTVAILIGSLRKESFTRKVANEIIKVAPLSLRFDAVDPAGKLISDSTRDFLRTPAESFARWIEVIIGGKT